MDRVGANARERPCPATENTTIAMEDAVAPSNSNSDNHILEIKFQNVNDMTRMKVQDADQNKTGKADYNITLNVVQASE